LLVDGKYQLAETSFVAMVLRLVSATRWRFGRVRGSELVHFSCDADDRQNLTIGRFLTCYRLLRRTGTANLTCVKDPVFPHAIALRFPDPVADAAMLVLLRDNEQGPFTREECALLALVADLGEEFLANSPLVEVPNPKSSVTCRRGPLVFIIDRSYRIVIRTSPYLDSNDADDTLRVPASDRLPEVIENAVRAMTTTWKTQPHAVVEAMAMPLPFLTVRAQSMESTNDGQYLAITIDCVRPHKVLQQAVERYQITPRERDVLAFLLDGMRIEEIADRLSIAISTVNDHVRSLISRTRSSNRSQMLARILGWDGSSAETRMMRTATTVSTWRGEDRVDRLADTSA
jgi:DNA-binding CsgD family transcriptional regulator